MNYTNKQLKKIMAKLLPDRTYLGVITGDLIWSIRKTWQANRIKR